MRACLRSRSPMLQQALSGGALPSAVAVQFLHTSGSHSLPALRQGQRSVRHCVRQLQPMNLQTSSSSCYSPYSCITKQEGKRCTQHKQGSNIQPSKPTCTEQHMNSSERQQLLVAI
jgi:hypothetical protein